MNKNIAFLIKMYYIRDMKRIAINIWSSLCNGLQSGTEYVHPIFNDGSPIM